MTQAAHLQRDTAISAQAEPLRFFFFLVCVRVQVNTKCVCITHIREEKKAKKFTLWQPYHRPPPHRNNRPNSSATISQDNYACIFARILVCLRYVYGAPSTL